MRLEHLKQIFSENGCNRLFVKRLAPNDNSKNQVYFGSSFDILNIFPFSDITTDSTGGLKRDCLKASLNFAWINNNSELIQAKKAQLILYPKYPEVRFSGFLKGNKGDHNELMRSRDDGRLLFLSVSVTGQILGHVEKSDSIIAKEFNVISGLSEQGLFSVIELNEDVGSRVILLRELKRIHQKEWIKSKRLDTSGSIIECTAPHCGGYTLEAELGIKPNGISDPDFLGWEIKQFGVKSFERLNSSIITLMTPEPTGGIYVDKGVEYFLRKYGYADKSGIIDRINFGGVYKVGCINKSTNLSLSLDGFDPESGKILKTNGKIIMHDQRDKEVASWDFASMLKHWNRKHNQACYVPSLNVRDPYLCYMYGRKIILGIHTDFHLFLREISSGNIYYDPGIKMEKASTNPKIKRRSQFRIKSLNLGNLYHTNELVDLADL